MPGTHSSANSGACGTLGPGNKCRDDSVCVDHPKEFRLIRVSAKSGSAASALEGGVRVLIAVCALTLWPVEPSWACKGTTAVNSAAFADVASTWRSVAPHSLIGSVYNTSSEQRAASEKFAQECPFGGPLREIQIPLNGVLAIGEVHDNREHHKVQALIAGMRAPGQVTQSAVVFEQIRADQQPALDQFAELRKDAEHPGTLSDLKRFLDWENSGWAKYNYDPLMQAAIDAKLPLIAGDVPRAEIMKVAKGGAEALPENERKRLALDVPLGDKNDAASIAAIEEAHCGVLPKEAFAPMAFAQRYRDATLADNVLKAAEKHGSAILIAGNEHVRTDRGVPWYIHQRAPDKKVVSVMLIEVEDGKNDPEAYVPRDADGKPAADYIIFTPAASHEGQCAKMRAKMGK